MDSRDRVDSLQVHPPPQDSPDILPPPPGAAHPGGTIRSTGLRSVLDAIPSAAYIFQVGGGQPLPRANAYIDCGWLQGPRKTGHQAETQAHMPAFTRSVDLSSASPRLPIPPHPVDFLVCLGIFPSIDAPACLWEQMQALAPAGYVEVPSRLWECTDQSAAFVGAQGNRWYTELRDSTLLFTGKGLSLSLHPELRFDRQELTGLGIPLDETHSVLGLWWAGPVAVRQIRFHSQPEELADLRDFKKRCLGTFRARPRHGETSRIWGIHRVAGIVNHGPTGRSQSPDGVMVKGLKGVRPNRALAGTGPASRQRPGETAAESLEPSCWDLPAIYLGAAKPEGRRDRATRNRR